MKIKTKEEFEIALRDKHWTVRSAAVKSEYFEAKYMDTALNDEDWYVRRAAVRSEYFEAKHMEIALSDEDHSVRFAAVQSKHFNSYCYIKYLDDHYGKVKSHED